MESINEDFLIKTPNGNLPLGWPQNSLGWPKHWKLLLFQNLPFVSKANLRNVAAARAVPWCWVGKRRPGNWQQRSEKEQPRTPAFQSDGFYVAERSDSSGSDNQPSK